MIEEKYILLIHKQFRGELSDPDQEVLQTWLDQDASHQKIVVEMKKTWQLSQAYQAEYTPNVELGLQALKKRIHADQTVPTPATAKVRRIYPRLAVAASVLVLVAALSVWNFWIRSENLQIVSTGPEEQKTIQLADGSTVLLNENSQLKYSPTIKSKRQVYLSGEAYFDIVHQEDMAFQVLTSKTRTDVLGTVFNIRSYNDESFTEVEVIDGIVRFSALEASNDASVEVKKGHRGTFEHKAGLKTIRPKSLNSTYWKEGYFRFKGQSLTDAIKEIENRLKLQIDLKNPEISGCALSQRVPIEHPDTLVATIADPYNAQWNKIAEDHYVIEGGSCSKN